MLGSMSFPCIKDQDKMGQETNTGLLLDRHIAEGNMIIAQKTDLPLSRRRWRDSRRGQKNTGPVVAEELSNMQSACRMQSTRCVWRYVPCIDCDGRVGV